jgi:hypothetical protein
MQVSMEDLLPRNTAAVPADVVALWLVFRIEQLFHLLQKGVCRRPLILGKIKDCLSVLFGNNDARSDQHLLRLLQEEAVFVLQYNLLSLIVFQAAERARHILLL